MSAVHAPAPRSRSRASARVGWLRWTWRQLTSMRTALFLLLLLAIGAIPGSTFPQRSIDPARTTAWIADHPTAGPVLDRLGLLRGLRLAVVRRDLPAALRLAHRLRAAAHAGSSGTRCARPRRAPRAASTGSPPTARRPSTARPRRCASGCGSPCSSRRYRVHAHDDETLSAEKGYLRETGNLVFHVALIGVLIGVAWGHLLGWKGDVIVPVGKTFANTLSRYDTFSPGPWVDVNALEPVHDHGSTGSTPTFETEAKSPGQFGAPRDFEAFTTFTDADGKQRAAQHPGQPPARDRRRLGLPARQRLRPGHHRARRRGHGALLRRHAVPAAGQQLHLGRRGEGARRLARAARASPGSSCPTGRHRRPGPALGLPRRRSTRSWPSPPSRATCSPAAARSRSTRSTPPR